MHPRLHPVFRRQRQQRFVIGDHQRALRRDAVCKGRQIRHIGQHRSQLLLPDKSIGVAVDPQRPLLLPLQRHDQLLVRQYVGLPAQKVVVLVQRQHRHALLPGDALQRFTGLHHMDPLRFINDQRLAHCQRAVGRRCVQSSQQRGTDAVLPRYGIQALSRLYHMDLHTLSPHRLLYAPAPP